MFEEKFFVRKKINPGKLLSYGFAEENGIYKYSVSVMKGDFLLHVLITEGGLVSTKMIDSASGEEYTLYKVEYSEGSYVGSVRAACEEALRDIAARCFDEAAFKSPQTAALIEYVSEKYGDEPEFLWEKSPDCAVFRRKESGKWYGIIMTIPRKKLGLKSDETVEIIDLHLDPSEMAETVDNIKYFPGWHMNKKSWYTVILDGSVTNKELFKRVDESYRLAAK